MYNIQAKLDDGAPWITHLMEDAHGNFDMTVAPFERV